jgi:hypothetical protein
VKFYSSRLFRWPAFLSTAAREKIYAFGRYLSEEKKKEKRKKEKKGEKRKKQPRGEPKFLPLIPFTAAGGQKQYSLSPLSEIRW